MHLDVERSGLKVDAILLGLLVTSLTINVALTLMRPAGIGTGSSRSDRPEPLPINSQAPLFQGTDTDGRRISISYGSDDKNVLLYVFSPTCHWCDRNKANIAAIVKANPSLRIFAVNIGPPLSQTERLKLPFSSVVRPSLATLKAYRFAGTPATLLIGSNGKVLANWSGAYVDSVAASVSERLGVSLPGLTNESQ
jgi:hypothetical protein